MRKTYSFLFILLCLLACSKEKSRKWLVIDFSAVNALNGEPVNGMLELQYTVSGQYIGSEKKLVEIGETSDGKKYIEHSVNRKWSNFALHFYPDGGYGPPNGTFYIETYGLGTGQKNVKKLVLDPIYYFTEHFKNVNCMGELDSMWISEPYQFPYTGCIDSTFINIAFPIRYTANPQQHYMLKVKRDGVISYVQKDFILEAGGKINTLLIEY